VFVIGLMRIPQKKWIHIKRNVFLQLGYSELNVALSEITPKYIY
jgi:hypothetical protein